MTTKTPADSFMSRYRQWGTGCTAADAGCPDMASVAGDLFRRHVQIDGLAYVWIGLRHDGPDTVDLVWIKAQPDSAKHGTRVLAELVASADTFGVTLRTVPGGRQEHLVRWYKRHGFDGPSHSMKRAPKPDA